MGNIIESNVESHEMEFFVEMNKSQKILPLNQLLHFDNVDLYLNFRQGPLELHFQVHFTGSSIYMFWYINDSSGFEYSEILYSEYKSGQNRHHWF